MTMFTKTISAAIAALAFPLAASADTITLSQESGAGNVTFPGIFGDPALYSAVQIGGDNMSTMNVYAGGFNVVSSSNESYLAWCIDLAESLVLSSTYDVVDSPFVATVTDNLSRLFTGYIEDIDTGVEAAAFQVAIWEMISDATPDLGAGEFQLLSNAAVETEATNYLTGFSAFDADYDLSFFVADGTQDLVTGQRGLTPPDSGGLTPVPLPASGLLLIAGLAALGMGARKRA